MKLINRIFSFFKEGSMNGTKVSSKRIIMYTMTSLIVFMVIIEATFNLLLMYKWANGECEDDVVKFQMVFDTIIYAHIFGLLAALSGINGLVTHAKNKVPTDAPD